MKAKQDASNYLVYLAIANITSVINGVWREDNRIRLTNRVLVSDLRSSTHGLSSRPERGS